MNERMGSSQSVDALRADVRSAYDAAVSAVAAGPAAARGLADAGPVLDCAGRVLVVAVGKAAKPMAAACVGLGRTLVLSPDRGPTRAAEPLSSQHCEYLYGGHPIPSQEGISASRRILDEVSSLQASDRLLVLLSGGASALFEVPPPELSSRDTAELYEALVRGGLPIEEMNLVRSALSAVKGGRLAEAARPARTVTLAISDVVGDEPAVIGSGPTVASGGTPREVERLLAALDLDPGLRARALAVLQPPVEDDGTAVYEIVASAGDAARAACGALEGSGYELLDAPFDPLLGDVEEVAKAVAESIRSHHDKSERWAWVSAGETTVRVPSGAGDGGRNRHLACRVAELLDGLPGFALLAAGTDGIDGTNSGAGAIVDGETVARIRSAGLDVADSLRSFDSATALAAADDQIVTGPSGTNVGDLLVAVGGAVV